MSIFRKLGWFFHQEKKHYLIGVFSLFAVALVQLVPPKVIGIIIDEIADKNLSVKIIFGWIFLLIIAAFLQYLFRYIWRTNMEVQLGWRKNFGSSYSNILQKWTISFTKNIGLGI